MFRFFPDSTNEYDTNLSSTTINNESDHFMIDLNMLKPQQKGKPSLKQYWSDAVSKPKFFLVQDE